MFCSLSSSYFSFHVFLVGVPRRRVHRHHWDPNEALAHITIAVGFTETQYSSTANTSTPYTTLPRLSSSTNKSGSLPSGLVFSRQQTCSLKQWRNCSILKKKVFSLLSNFKVHPTDPPPHHPSNPMPTSFQAPALSQSFRTFTDAFKFLQTSVYVPTLDKM